MKTRFGLPNYRTMNRKRINDLVEPMKGGWLSLVYDYIMLIAIIIGTIPLFYREYRPLFVYFDLISGIIYMVDYVLRWITCDLRSDKPKWKAFLLYPFTPMAILDLLSILPTFSLLAPSYRLTKAIRLFKIVRFTKIINYFEPLGLFFAVVKKQWKMLLAVLVVALFDISSYQGSLFLTLTLSPPSPAMLICLAGSFRRSYVSMRSTLIFQSTANMPWFFRISSQESRSILSSAAGKNTRFHTSLRSHAGKDPGSNT